MKRSLLIFLMTTALASAAHAQTTAPTVVNVTPGPGHVTKSAERPTGITSPVPATLASARKVFLSNAGAEAGLFPHPFTGTQDRAFYAILGANPALQMFSSGQGGPDGWQYLGGKPAAGDVIVLKAARRLDVASGKIVSPGVVVVRTGMIVAVENHVPMMSPQVGKVLELGDVTLMPGLIDAHVHLFLHPGAEDLQTVQESVPQRTLIAMDAAKLDLMAGFTAERDMGTEGAQSADTAIREAIDSGLFPGPRMRMSGNAIDLTGGHEDAIGYNPDQHILSNATFADSAQDLVKVIRAQRKEGADFTKIYETGKDHFSAGVFSTPYQYTEEELKAAVAEAARFDPRPGHGVAVHATGEPGTGYAVAAGVMSVDHAYQLSSATMKMMKEKGIPAVPTFAISEYFAEHAGSPEAAAHRKAEQAFHAEQFRKQLAAGVPMAVGSDVGPFPHGTQARELVLMAQYGMAPADVLRADYLNGARLLGWEGKIGELKAGFWADVIAVAGDPLADISAVMKVKFVMKGGVVVRKD